MKPTAGAIFVALSSLVVGAAVIAGLMLVGPPTQVRAHRLDQQRIQALDGLEMVVIDYQVQKGALPDTLDAALRQSKLTPSDARDPETGRPFEYRKSSATTFELCARFDAASGEDEAMRSRHGAGRACFASTVTPKQPPQPGAQPALTRSVG